MGAHAVAPRHPAKFNDPIKAEIQLMLEMGFGLDADPIKILDPFAGIGGVHDLVPEGRDWWTVGIEIEPEWAEAREGTMVGDATNLPFPDELFDAVVTSPCYGNRMADHHEARDDSRRNTYRHALGRPLSDGSAAGLQWGRKYQQLHQEAWTEAQRVLRPGGLFILNIKNHIRAGKEILVAEWHVRTLVDLGFKIIEANRIATPGLRQGANHDARVDHEWVITLERP